MALMPKRVKFRKEMRNVRDRKATKGNYVAYGDFGLQSLDGAWVTADLFDVLQVRPQLGRTFRREEETPGLGNVAVLSYSMWQDRYAGDPRILGKSIRANGQPYTVIGVMPPKFRYPDNQSIWMPLQIDATKLERGTGQRLEVVARLRTYDKVTRDLRGFAFREGAEPPGPATEVVAESRRVGELTSAVVPVGRHIESHDRDRHAFTRCDLVGHALGEDGPTVLDADEGQAFGAALPLHDLVADANERTADLIG